MEVNRKHLILATLALAVLAIGLYAFKGYDERHFEPVFAYPVDTVSYSFTPDANFFPAPPSTAVVFANSDTVPDVAQYYFSKSDMKLYFCVYEFNASPVCHVVTLPSNHRSSFIFGDHAALPCGRYLYVAYNTCYYGGSSHRNRYCRAYLLAYDLYTGQQHTINTHDFFYYRSASTEYHNGTDNYDWWLYDSYTRYNAPGSCDIVFNANRYDKYSSSSGRTEKSWEYVEKYYVRDASLLGTLSVVVDYSYDYRSSSGSYSCHRRDDLTTVGYGMLNGDYYMAYYVDHEEFGDCDYDRYSSTVTINRVVGPDTTITLPQPVRYYYHSYSSGGDYITFRFTHRSNSAYDRAYVYHVPTSTVYEVNTDTPLFSGSYYPGYVSTPIYNISGHLYLADDTNTPPAPPVPVSPSFVLPSGIYLSPYIYSCHVDTNTLTCNVYAAPPVAYSLDTNVLGILSYDENVTSVPVSLHADPVVNPDVNTQSARVAVYLDGTLFTSFDLNAFTPLDLNVPVSTPGDHTITLAVVSPTTTILNDFNTDSTYPASELYTLHTASFHVLSKPYGIQIYKVAPSDHNVYLAAVAFDDDVNSPTDLNYHWIFRIYYVNRPSLELNGPSLPTAHLSPEEYPQISNADFVDACLTVTDPNGLSTTRCATVDLTEVTENEAVRVIGPPEEVVRLHRHTIYVPVEIVQTLFGTYGIEVSSVPSTLSASPLPIDINISPTVAFATFGALAGLAIYLLVFGPK